MKVSSLSIHWSTYIISFLLLLSLAFAAHANEFPDKSSPSLIPSDGAIGNCSFVDGKLNAQCILAYVRYLIRLIFMFIGAFFLISIILAGYQIALGSVAGGAGGKEAGIKKLQFAIIGFMICAFAFFIIDFFVSALAG